MFDRDDVISYIWDVAKEATGVRPRWLNFDGMSDEDLSKTADMYEAQALEEHAFREAQQIEATKEFEDTVNNLIQIGANTRKTAIKWLFDADDLDYSDTGMFEYTYNLKYGYIKW